MADITAPDIGHCHAIFRSLSASKRQQQEDFQTVDIEAIMTGHQMSVTVLGAGTDGLMFKRAFSH